MSLLLIGQTLEAASARHERLEVLVDRPSAKSGAPSIVYITKYADGQIGERSVGMSVETAREVARLLGAAADALGAEK